MTTPEAKAGLQSLVDAYRSGAIPRESVTFQEEQARQAFQSGDLLFMRNWPYAYSLMNGQGSSAVSGKFAVAPLPGKNGPGHSTLGGHSAAINVYSEHKATASDFLKFFLEKKSQAFFLSQGRSRPSAPTSTRPGTDRAVPVHPHAEDVDRERRDPAGDPVLSRGHPGRAEQRVRRDQGREDGGPGRRRHPVRDRRGRVLEETSR